MKIILKNGLVACDLACNGNCMGYAFEGCLMFNEILTFKSAKWRLMGGGLVYDEKDMKPKGAWEEVFCIELDIRPINYIGEKVN